jgi:hypothetical protein
LKKLKRSNNINSSLNQGRRGDDAEDWESSKKETIRFGEVVDRPPDLSVFKLKMEEAKEKRVQILNKKAASSTPQELFDTQHYDEPSQKAKKRSLDELIASSSSDEYGTGAGSGLRAIIGKGKPSASTLNNEEMDRLREQAQLAYKAVKAKRLAKYT